MSGQKSWSRHYQDVWEERAGDPRLPKWMRVAALAYGMHRANGHACFPPGAIALVLGKPNGGDVVKEPNVGRIIKRAVEYGFLGEGSTSRCLIVPAHAIEGGLGSQHAICPMHGGGRR